MASGEEEALCSFSSLPAELLTLVAENLRIPNTSRLSALQPLARFAAASTACLAAAQGELQDAALLILQLGVAHLEEVRAVRAALSLPFDANHDPGLAKILGILRYQVLRRRGRLDEIWHQ